MTPPSHPAQKRQRVDSAAADGAGACAARSAEATLDELWASLPTSERESFKQHAFLLLMDQEAADATLDPNEAEDESEDRRGAMAKVRVPRAHVGTAFAGMCLVNARARTPRSRPSPSSSATSCLTPAEAPLVRSAPSPRPTSRAPSKVARRITLSSSTGPTALPPAVTCRLAEVATCVCDQ